MDDFGFGGEKKGLKWFLSFRFQSSRSAQIDFTTCTSSEVIAPCAMADRRHLRLRASSLSRTRVSLANSAAPCRPLSAACVKLATPGKARSLLREKGPAGCEPGRASEVNLQRQGSHKPGSSTSAKQIYGATPGAMAFGKVIYLDQIDPGSDPPPRTGQPRSVPRHQRRQTRWQTRAGSALARARLEPAKAGDAALRRWRRR
jgi:hypothetical protein